MTPRVDADLFPDTELRKVTEIEVRYKQLLLSDLICVIDNFGFDTKLKFIGVMLAKLFGIILLDNDTLEVINSKVKSVFEALKHPGTYESTKILFNSFLGVELLSIDVDKPGSVEIKMLEPPRISQPTIIKRLRGWSLIVIFNNGVPKKLAAASMPIAYAQNVFSYIKQLLPIGRDVKVVPYRQPENAPAVTV